MSSRNYRSNLHPTILLTAGMHYTYTRANTFISMPFTAVISLMTLTLSTRPWGTWLQALRARVQRSLNVSPTQFWQGHGSTAEPDAD
jgi:hypothetical protein